MLGDEVDDILIEVELIIDDELCRDTLDDSDDGTFVADVVVVVDSSVVRPRLVFE